MADLSSHSSRPRLSRFRAEVLNGLKKSQKELPSKYFYDQRGSELFEQITTLEEYYVTRTETALMQAHAAEMAAALGPHVLLIEYGSGSSTKTRLILSHLDQPVGYIPIDISQEQLWSAAESITRDFPGLEVLPVCADYTTVFELPAVKHPPARRVVYFPGSTIGNFDPLPAKQFLERIAEVCGSNGALLIGIDLKKDPVVLHQAYNDLQGITAAFNLNLLERINRDLDGNFELDKFKHYAFYNPRRSRIEMHLVSEADQQIQIGDVAIPLKQGESIWTESSYKFTLDEFVELVSEAGFSVERAWFDAQHWFSMVCCAVQ